MFKKAFCIFCLFFLIHTSFSQDQTQNNETLLFRAEGNITEGSRQLQTGFIKGLSLTLPVKANQRYAAVIRSQTLDTALRVEIDEIQVFRDLFLGEDAGLLFTPKTNNNDRQTVIITSLFSPSVNQGDYTLYMYEVVSPQSIEPESALENQTLSEETKLVGRITKEYAVQLDENKRFYVYMESDNFDTLLEFADRNGNTSVSDDWSRDEDKTSSFLSVVIPQTDTYFINTTSFNGLTTGDFFLQTKVTDNITELSQTDRITTENTKIFEQYINEYLLELTQGEVRTIELIALSGDIEVLFTNEERSAIYTQNIVEGETLSVPVIAQQAGTYKIIVSSQAKTPTNYSITIFR